jgi:hypothetical protein
MSCGKIKFFKDNYVQAVATNITVLTDENAFFPAENLKNPKQSKLYKTKDGTLTGQIELDFQTIEDVDSFLIQGPKGFTGDVTIEANIVSGSWGAPPFSTTVSVNDEELFGFQLLDVAVQYRFWRVTFTNTAGNAYISNIYIGKRFEPNKNIVYGWSYTETDFSKVSRSNDVGQVFIDKIETKQKNINASFELLTPSELKDILTMFRQVGKHSPIWTIIDSDELISIDAELFAGQFYVSKSPVFTNPTHAKFNAPFSLKEII